ncbi:MAG: trypsin-like peptidase domain-containing protein [Hyphomonas sp.]
MPYIPMLGEVAPDVPGQFNASRFDALSFKTTPIEIHGVDSVETVVGHASGFFWRQKEQSYLITNRHVVTNRNGFTNEYVSQCLQPRKITFYSGEWISPIDAPAGFFRFERTPQKLDLYNDNEVSIWLEDPLFQKFRTDIVAIPIDYQPTIKDSNQSPFLNNFGFENLSHYVGNDLFVVGYPYRNYTGMMIPVWKRGSLASEPLFGVDKKPMFLIDALTKDGMSGSPVFKRVFGPVNLACGTTKLDHVVTTEFVGVYSGRLGSSDLAQAAMGMAWYSNRIPHIITSGCTTSFNTVHPQS